MVTTVMQTTTAAAPPPAVVLRTQTVQAPARVSQPAPAPSGCNCGVADLPVQCGDGLGGSSGTSCAFANNAFYEYWQASGGNPSATSGVNVWSAQDQLYYPLNCDSGDGVVDCTAASGEDVRFAQTALSAYTDSQARTYAASGKLGPNG